jgi:5'-3' exonuclease
MGIKKLNKFLNVYCKDETLKIHFSQLYGKRVAVDIMIYIYKYAAEKTIIEGIYLLCSLFKKYNVIPIFVFDGKIPEAKEQTLEKRRQRRQASKMKYEKLINQDNLDIRNSKIKSELLTLKRDSVKLKYGDVDNVRDLVEAFGYSYIIANGEADKLCAELVLSNIVYACISEDTDLFVYGCPRILRYFNLFNEVCVLYDLKNILKKLQINLDNFKKLCILAGCDYNETIINIFKGYNYYLKYLKKDRGLTFIEWINQWKEKYTVETDIMEIYKCNRKDKVTVRNDKCDLSKIYKILEKDNFIFV